MAHRNCVPAGCNLMFTVDVPYATRSLVAHTAYRDGQCKLAAPGIQGDNIQFSTYFNSPSSARQILKSPSD